MDFEKAYERYFQNVYRYVCSMTGDRNLAEEVSQETFLKAMEAIDRFDGQKDILAWLFTIAKNTYISPFVFPWDQTGPNSHVLVSWPNETGTDTIFKVVCADQEFTYSMEEQGLWDERSAHSPELCPHCPK